MGYFFQKLGFRNGPQTRRIVRKTSSILSASKHSCCEIANSCSETTSNESLSQSTTDRSCSDGGAESTITSNTILHDYEEDGQQSQSQSPPSCCSSSNSEQPVLQDGPQELSEAQDPQASITHFRPVAQLQRKEIQTGKLLGRGSFSEVYEVSNLKLSATKKNTGGQLLTIHEQTLRQSLKNDINSKKYAVKYLSRKLLRRPKDFYDAAMDLSREAEIMASLDHPHILKARASTFGGTEAFAETGRFDGFFIVSDLLSDTLTQRIQQWQRLPIYKEMSRLQKLIMKTQYAQQLASAVDYLHDRRIIFRDLKPDNCGFLDDAQDTLQLFDFGLCRTLPPSASKTVRGCDPEDEMFLMSMAGTVRYLSPEVLSSGKYNLKADSHSFAMVCYEMYAEKKPFQNLHLNAFQEFVCRSKVRPNVHQLHLPVALDSLIVGCWCPDVLERLSMKDVCEILPAILSDIESARKENEVEC